MKQEHVKLSINKKIIAARNFDMVLKPTSHRKTYRYTNKNYRNNKNKNLKVQLSGKSNYRKRTQSSSLNRMDQVSSLLGVASGVAAPNVVDQLLDFSKIGHNIDILKQIDLLNGSLNKEVFLQNQIWASLQRAIRDHDENHILAYQRQYDELTPKIDSIKKQIQEAAPSKMAEHVAFSSLFTFAGAFVGSFIVPVLFRIGGSIFNGLRKMVGLRPVRFTKIHPPSPKVIAAGGALSGCIAGGIRGGLYGSALGPTGTAIGILIGVAAGGIAGGLGGFLGGFLFKKLFYRNHQLNQFKMDISPY